MALRVASVRLWHSKQVVHKLEADAGPPLKTEKEAEAEAEAHMGVGIQHHMQRNVKASDVDNEITEIRIQLFIIITQMACQAGV